MRKSLRRALIVGSFCLWMSPVEAAAPLFTVATDGMQQVDLDGDGTLDADFMMFVQGDGSAARGYALFQHAEFQAVAVFDLGELEPQEPPSVLLSGILRINTVDSHPQEVLDLVAAATGDLFQGGKVKFNFDLSNGERFSFEAEGVVERFGHGPPRR